MKLQSLYFAKYLLSKFTLILLFQAKLLDFGQQYDVPLLFLLLLEAAFLRSCRISLLVQLFLKFTINRFSLLFFFVASFFNYLDPVLFLLGFNFSFFQVDFWPATSVFLFIFIRSRIYFCFLFQNFQHSLFKSNIYTKLLDFRLKPLKLLRSFTHLFFNLRQF